MRKQRFWYAAAAATVLLAAGCNGGADNQPSPTPTPTVSSPTASPSDSGSPSPSASVSIPAEAMAQTPEGAVAFVKFFFDEVNRAYLEPNGGILPGLGDPDCRSCASLQANAEEYVANNQRYSSSALSVSDPRAADGAPIGQQFVTLTLNQLAANVVDGSGATVSTKEAKSVERRVLLTWRGDRWLVFDIG